MIRAMMMGERIRRSLWRLASARMAALETAAEGLTAGATELELELETAAKRPEEPDPEPRLMRFQVGANFSGGLGAQVGIFFQRFQNYVF